MSTIEQIRDGFNRAWETITEGWRELREGAAEALTRFEPARGDGTVETAEDRVAQQAARWGLLAAEVSTSDDAVLVSLELPGLEVDDIELEVSGNLLMVRGEKRVERRAEHGRYHVLERAYGRFERAVRLPAAVDEDKARACYRNGILNVTLPRTAAGRRSRIPVDGA